MSKNNTNWKPDHKYLLVKGVDEKVTESGIYLPVFKSPENKNTEGTEIGEVLDVADNANKKYKSVKLILYPKNARGASWKDEEGRDYRFVLEDDIIAYE